MNPLNVRHVSYILLELDPSLVHQLIFFLLTWYHSSILDFDNLFIPDIYFMHVNIAWYFESQKWYFGNRTSFRRITYQFALKESVIGLHMVLEHVHGSDAMLECS